MTQPEVEEARERVIEGFERVAATYGGKTRHGRLYGILFFAEGPVSLDELVKRIGAAKSTVSTSMKTLEEVHLIERVSVPDEGKRAFYRARTDYLTVLQDFLAAHVRHEINVMQTALSDAEILLDQADNTKSAQHDLEKVRRLQRLYDRSEKFLRTITTLSSSSLTEVLGKAYRDFDDSHEN